MNPNESVRFQQEVWFDGHQYGSTTGIPTGQIKIRRGSDNQFWNGTAFVPVEQWVATTIDSGGLFHYYDFTFPATLDEFYTVRQRVNNDPATEQVGTAIVRGSGGGGSTVYYPLFVFDD